MNKKPPKELTVDEQIKIFAEILVSILLKEMEEENRWIQITEEVEEP